MLQCSIMEIAGALTKCYRSRAQPGRAMRLFLAIVAILLVAVFFAYPPLLEGSDGECSALDQRITDRSSHDGTGRLTVGALYGSSSSSPGAAAFVRDRYSALPPAAACAIAYWKMLFGPADAILVAPVRTAAVPAASEAPPSSSEPPSPATPHPPASVASAVAPTVARGVTPNGDPISPATAFTLPMPGVAIRVDYPGGKADAVRFQLMQGRAVLSSCAAQRGAPGTAWCKFNMSLRKGAYSIAVTANNTPLGQFPFTVLGN